MFNVIFNNFIKLFKWLLGYCGWCNSYFKYPKKVRRLCEYTDDKLNWTVMCTDCKQRDDEHWEDQWKDVYGSGYSKIKNER